MDLAIGGVSVALLIAGLVEFAKKFNVSGNGSAALAFGLGVGLTFLAYGITEGLFPAVAVPYIKWSVVAIAGGPAAMGYYDMAKRFLSK